MANILSIIGCIAAGIIFLPVAIKIVLGLGLCIYWALSSFCRCLYELFEIIATLVIVGIAEVIDRIKRKREHKQKYGRSL